MMDKELGNREIWQECEKIMDGLCQKYREFMNSILL